MHLSLSTFFANLFSDQAGRVVRGSNKKIWLPICWLFVGPWTPAARADVYAHAASIEQRVDSLQQLLDVRTGMARVDVLNQLGQAFQSVHFDSMAHYFHRAHREAQQVDYVEGQFTSLIGLTQAFEGRGLTDSALYYVQMARDLARTKGDESNQHQAEFRYASVLLVQGDYENALRILLDCVRFFEASEDSLGLARTYNAVAIAYAEFGELASALEYFKKQRDLCTQMGNISLLSQVYLNIGNVLMLLERNEEAAEQFRQSLLWGERTHNTNSNAFALNALGKLSERRGDFVRAEDYFTRSLELHHQLSNPEGEAYTLISLGHMAQLQRRPQKAYDYFSRCLALSRQLGDPLLVEDALNWMATAEADRGGFARAYELTRERQVIRDSILGQEKQRALLSLREAFETEKKNEEIRYLQQTQELQTAVIARKDTEQRALLLLLVLVVLLTAAAFVIFWQRQRASRQIHRKNEEIYKQRIEAMLRAQEIRSFDAVMEAQLAERKRIARDLHDRLGSLLSTAKFNYSALCAEVQPLTAHYHDQYEQVNGLIDRACQEVRQIAQVMVSSETAHFSLRPALLELKGMLEASGLIRVELVVHGLAEMSLDSGRQLELYRIVQELISNILRHAQATQITIQITQHDQNINLLVEDDGVGFNTWEGNRKGMGLKNIQVRVEKLNGSCHVDSGKGNGTTVIVDLPLS